MKLEHSLLEDLIDLYARYASALDNGPLEDWPEFFTEDCGYRLIPRENYDAGYRLATMSLDSKGMLKDRVYAARSTLFHAPYYQRHIIGLPRILERSEGSCRVEVNYTVIRTKRDLRSEVFNTGRYLDHVVLDNAVLKFAEKLCVFDSEMIPNSIIYPI